MKRSAVWCSLVLITSFIFTYSSPSVAMANSLEKKVDNIEKEESENVNKKEKVEKEKENLTAKQNETENKIEELDMAILENNQKMTKIEEQVTSTQEKINELKKEIEQIKKRIEERDQLLKNRVRSMQQSGGSVEYLEVLVGSEGFVDFIQRVSALNTIAEKDKELLNKQKKDKLTVEKKADSLQQALSTLEDDLNKLKALKVELEDKKEEKRKVMSKYKEKEGQLETSLKDIEESNDLLRAQKIAIKQEIKRNKEEKRKAEEQKEKEREIKKQESKQAESLKPKGEKNKPSSSSGFSWPASASVTSSFGNRSMGYHEGLDIAKGGVVPIKAAASGTVLKSYYSSSYGNVVFLTHKQNGQTYTTVYAHMRNRTVKTGEKVSQGQRLGKMGNTGRSFGQHLHFELHKGAWNAEKSNAVDPLSYLP